MPIDEPDISIGTTVSDEDGDARGEMGPTADGFAVTTREGIEALSTEHERAGHEFGEAELRWRCDTCDELGAVQDIPGNCPSCGADRPTLYDWTGD
jgi:hypothetical protein